MKAGVLTLAQVFFSEFLRLFKSSLQNTSGGLLYQVIIKDFIILILNVFRFLFLVEEF